ncbi:hypothetical protein JCM11251_000554 [Rhodosporidiobolus azoricus]
MNPPPPPPHPQFHRPTPQQHMQQLPPQQHQQQHQQQFYHQGPPPPQQNGLPIPPGQRQPIARQAPIRMQQGQPGPPGMAQQRVQMVGGPPGGMQQPGQGGGGPGGPPSGGMGPPPPGMQRGAPPPGQQVIGPSHPQHPQHQAWLAQQESQRQQGGGPPNYLPNPPPLPPQNQQHQQPFLPNPPPPQQHRMPPQQGGYLPQPPPPSGLNALPQPPLQRSHSPSFQPPTPVGGGPPQQGSFSVAPTARVIPSRGGPGGPPPPHQQQQQQNPSMNPSLPQPPPSQNGALYAPSPQPPHANIPMRQQPPPIQTQQLPPPPPSSGHPGSIPPTPQQQHAQGITMPPMQQQQQPQLVPQGRPIYRSSFGPSAPNTLLAAHLAVHGNGSITATPAPAGPALSRIAALNDAIVQASEDLNPLEALRSVAAEHFTDTGVVKVGLYDKVAQLSKVFEIPCSAWPRFQHLNLLLGALTSTVTTTFAREFRLTTSDPSSPTPSPPGPSSPNDPPLPPPLGTPMVHIGYLLHSPEAAWSSRFLSGTKIDLVGSLTVHLMFKDLGTGSAGLRIESLEFESRGHEEWVERGGWQVLPSSVLSPAVGGTAVLANAVGGLGKEDQHAGSEEKDRSKSKKGGAAGLAKETPPVPATKGMITRRRSASAKSNHSHSASEDLSRQAELEAERALAGVLEEDVVAGVQEVKEEDEGVKGGEGGGPGGKKGLGRAVRVPVSPVGPFGVTEMGMRCLEIAESVAQLQDLISFSLETGTGPIQSLARYADRFRQQSTQRTPLTGPPSALGPPPPPYPSTPSGQPQSPYPVHPSQQDPQRPPTAIAATQQNPSTNSFYSSVTASPGGPVQPLPLPPQQGKGQVGRRPGSGGGANGAEAQSPVEFGGKRKLSGGNGGPVPNGRAGAEGRGADDEAGSPQKVQRTNAGGGGLKGRRGR